MSWTLKLVTFLAEHKRLEVNTSRCLHERYKDSTCTKCTAVCPSPKALQVADGVNYDASSCTECMQCVSACPTQVFQNNQLKQQLQATLNRESVAFGCEQVGTKESHVLLPCLAQLELFHLLFAGLNSKNISVWLNETRCEQCTLFRPGMFTHLTGLISTAQSLLAACKPGTRISMTAETQAEKEQQQQYSRRELLSLLTAKSKDFSTSAALSMLPLPGEMVNMREKRTVPGTNRFLYNLVRRLAEDKAGDLTLSTKYLKCAKVQVADSCTCCGVCTIFCPTGSLLLEVNEPGEKAVLSQSLSKCVDCGLCREVCPEQAISNEETVLLSDYLSSNPAAIFTRTLVRCKRCGNPALTGDLCDKCARKQRQEESADGVFLY